MSAPHHQPSTLAALTDKELEILRLLTSGHTVKSIAARLGRSEASINERLREARRKTGFSSSRELARILDAQKIWDEKIDLSVGGPPANDAVQPRKERSARSKGMIVMLFALSIAAAALTLAGPDAAHRDAAKSAQVTASAQAPLVGTWSLDIARVPVEERPRRVTIRFASTADGQWTTRVDIVNPDGSTRHAESTAALNGVPVPVSGNMGIIDSASLRQPAPGTLVMTLGKAGTPVSTRVYAVAKDGRSMTETIVWPGDTMPKLETNHFNRIN